MAITLRSAVPADVPVILTFVRELADYAREPEAVVATERLIHDTLFGPTPHVYAVLAEQDGIPVGFAIYFFNFSTWLGRSGLYLEDLYVRPSARAAGIGKHLLVHLAQVAVARGCGRMEWSVLTWNEPAIGFYRKLGAFPLDECRTFRLTGDALTALAATT